MMKIFRLLTMVLSTLCCVVGPVCAGDDEIGYVVPVVGDAAFTKDGLDMVMAEREEYSRNLAATANHLLMSSALMEGAEASLLVDPELAAPLMPLVNRLMALAFELSPRVKTTVVINHQFKKGMTAKHYHPEVTQRTLASVMQLRAGQLRDEGGEENLLLAGCLLDLAVALDPQNEDAIFSLELMRMDGNAPDWKRIGRGH